MIFQGHMTATEPGIPMESPSFTQSDMSKERVKARTIEMLEAGWDCQQ